ncbi:MAG: alanine dehydrogenase [Bacillota bacterium]|nr:alanine dehydrogenase [Bacillota bacterium]
MFIGCTKELKNNEFRVGLTPDGVSALVAAGHKVYIEKGAGKAAGFEDSEYKAVGAVIKKTAKEVFDISDMIIKVKELEPEEFSLVHEGQILYTYLHLASNPAFAKLLIDKHIQSVAYETIKDRDGNLPCLRPMSQIAGRLSIQEGAKYIERSFGGRGILLGGVPGVERGTIVILGGGVAGTYAAKAAVGIDANVVLLDISASRLAYIEDIFGASVTTLYSTEENIKRSLAKADLVIGSVLIPGAATPHLIKKEYLKLMKKGSVIVDIAIDQGGCCETSHTTTHDDPVFIKDGVVHYCVGNMPGAVPYTSTVALTNATIKYALDIANKGLRQAMLDDAGLRNGLNIYKGRCTNENVAKAIKSKYIDPLTLLD